MTCCVVLCCAVLCNVCVRLLCVCCDALCCVVLCCVVVKYPFFSHTYSVTLCTLHDIMPSTLMYFGSSMAQDKITLVMPRSKTGLAVSETLGSTLVVR